MYLWIVRTTWLSYNDQARSAGVVKSDALQSVHQTIRTGCRHRFRPLAVTLGAQWEFKINTDTNYFHLMSLETVTKHTVCCLRFGQKLGWNWTNQNVNQIIHHCPLEPLPDSAYVAGTTFSRALIEDNRELHLIPGLELQAILHFFYMEEQLLAFTNFICDEAKLGGGDNTTSGFKFGSHSLQHNLCWGNFNSGVSNAREDE